MDVYIQIHDCIKLCNHGAFREFTITLSTPFMEP